MKKTVLFHLLLVCPTVFLVWYVLFPNTMWFMESDTFFYTAPDFVTLQLSLPADWMDYAGAWILQFFYLKAGGALIQTLFATIVLLLSDYVLFCLFRNKRLLWLSFIPVVWFISGQITDMTLIRSISWCTIAAAVAVLARLAVWKRYKQSRGNHSWLASPFLSYLVPCLLLAGGVFRQATDKTALEQEETFRIDRWADNKEWGAILARVTPEEAHRSPTKQRWALLALSEIGQLPDKMFSYGITSPSGFLYERQNRQFCHNFNIQFYKALGIYNEVLHHAFQAGIQSRYGMNFRSLRYILEANQLLGNEPLVNKYKCIAQHSSCSDWWKELDTENTAPDKPARSFFIGARSFLSDMARLVDCHPDNRKAVDYLLCGLLVSKDVDKFYKAFGMIPQASSGRLPRYYEEAILVAALKYPEALHRYNISAERTKEFQTFLSLLKSKATDKRMLEMKYRDSFWFHLYCTK